MPDVTPDPLRVEVTDYLKSCRAHMELIRSAINVEVVMYQFPCGLTLSWDGCELTRGEGWPDA